MNIRYTMLAVVIIANIVASVGHCQSNLPEPKEMPTSQFKGIIDKSVASLLAGQNAVRGLVVGVVHGDRKEVYGYGKTDKRSGKIPDGNTLFGIASLTKPLTALLLAQLSVEGKLTYDDTAIRFKNKPVTFRQLVTHTSGLPLLPSNMRRGKAEYSLEKFRSFLREHSLEREPGNQFAYSTVGFGVLGMALGQKCESGSFGACLKKKVLKPLGMSSTVFSMPYNKGQHPLSASGGLMSSANDLMRFVSATLQPQLYPKVAKAITLTHQHCPGIHTFPGSIATLGWHVLIPPSFYWGSGVSSKSMAFITFDIKNNCGVVVMTTPGLPPTDTRVATAGFTLLGSLGEME